MWKTTGYLILKRAGGHTSIRSPGLYHTHPDYRILSNSGQGLALPVGDSLEMSNLYYVSLSNKQVSCLERGHAAYEPRNSADERYLSADIHGVKPPTSSHLCVYDLARKTRIIVGTDLTNISWSKHGHTLLFRNRSGRLQAFDAGKSWTYDMGSKQVDRLLGSAYRLATMLPQQPHMAEVSPSKRWAFVGALQGGQNPFANFLGADDPIKPYRWGFVDRAGKLHSFPGPDAHEYDELLPLAWTRQDRLAFFMESDRNNILLFDPSTGQSDIFPIKPPELDADLIAIKF